MNAQPRNRDADQADQEKPKQPNTKKSPIRYKKTNLPSKDCVVCGRPFDWRKKWERCWDEVRFCSERCRRNRTGGHA
ncbi:DUF2256 domain-containing protein [bacterium]|nr:DUF2256 domain-containing protein [bacterium]